MAGSLQTLEVMAVDCQTTGATPALGQIIELAWCRTRGQRARGDRPIEVRSSLVCLPRGATLVPRIGKITGIPEQVLRAAPDPEQVWHLFQGDLRAVAADDKPLIVAHYARFERAFLEDLRDKHGPDLELAARFVCTYEIARRVLSSLPKHSLRALAGFFGHTLPERRRAADHVRATALIWSELTRELERRFSISDPGALFELLKTDAPRLPEKKVFPMPAERRGSLPSHPGIYRFVDRSGNPLYVGKAANLRQRVGSYFHGAGAKAGHIREMLAQAHDVEIVQTHSATEAALLEVDEIKRTDAPYNKALRADSESICFFSPDLKLTSTRQDERCFVGPFPRKEPIEAAGRICDLLNNGVATTPYLLEAIFGGQARFTDEIEPGIAEQGAELFKEAMLAGAGGPVDARALISAGAVFGQYERRVKAGEADSAPGEEKTEPDTDPRDQEILWTPGRFARLLARAAASAARLWQRSIWLKLLSESSIAWQSSRHAGTPRRRLLLIEGATVVEARDLPESDLLPPPAGQLRPVVRRGEYFDRAAYDRLSVLTAELRRLVSNGGPVELRFTDHCRKDRSSLAGLLEWV